MITLEHWQQIRHLSAQGHSQRRIARALGLSRNTVKRALEQPTPPRYERPATASASLEPLRSQIEAGRRRGKTGVRLFHEAQKNGYTASRATFYRGLEQIDAVLRPPQASIRFETDPGEQAQFDWSPYRLLFGGRPTPVFVYSLLLGYSRRAHFFPSLAENQPAVFEAIEAGLRHFGGSCRFLLIDNAKVFVLSHSDAKVVFNEAFLRLCGHYSIQPIAATPRHPQGKDG